MYSVMNITCGPLWSCVNEPVCVEINSTGGGGEDYRSLKHVVPAPGSPSCPASTCGT